MTREVALYARSIDLASGLRLKIFAAADVVCVRMGAQYRAQRPAVFVKYLPYLSAGLLVVSAVDKINALIPVEIKSDFGRTVNVISVV